MKQPGDSEARPRALFLSPEAPYPAIGGGALRSASVLEFLAQHYDVDAIIFSERGSPDPRAAFPPGRARNIWIVELPPHSRSSLARHWRAASRLLRNRPPLIDRFSGFERQIAAALAAHGKIPSCDEIPSRDRQGAVAPGHDYDLAIVEHLWCAPYLKQIRPLARRVFLDAHNIESAWHQRVAQSAGPLRRPAFEMFAQACRRFERRWLPQFDAVMVASAEDARRIPEARSFVYPNAIPLVDRPVRREEHAILFTGNLEYEPNIAAVRHFRDKIWPLVRQRAPAVEWRIAGKNPGAIQDFVNGDPRIRVTGVMEDAIATLGCAKIAVVPLLSGSGTRFKILEAWAAGTPVISTPIGAEGLTCNAGEHLLLCETPLEFAAAIAFLLEAPEARLQLAEAGRRLYERSYTWDAAWDTLRQQLILESGDALFR